MSEDHITALRQLVKALNDFGDSGEFSYGFDPDNVNFEAVNPGGYVHEAVCRLETFYGGGLPVLGPRELWSDLLHACRDHRDRRRARDPATKLLDWVKAEIAELRQNHVR